MELVPHCLFLDSKTVVIFTPQCSIRWTEGVLVLNQCHTVYFLDSKNVVIFTYYCSIRWAVLGWKKFHTVYFLDLETNFCAQARVDGPAHTAAPSSAAPPSSPVGRTTPPPPFPTVHTTPSPHEQSGPVVIIAQSSVVQNHVTQHLSIHCSFFILYILYSYNYLLVSQIHIQDTLQCLHFSDCTYIVYGNTLKSAVFCKI